MLHDQFRAAAKCAVTHGVHVTKDDVRRVARKYIDPNHLAIVVVGDKKTLAEPLGKLAPVEVRDLEGEPIASP